MISPQASENLHILMPPALINIYSFREISIFEMTALISCTSNTMLDINRPYIGGERWFGIFATTALMFSPQQAPRFYKPSRWPANLINMCSFWEYRLSPWRYCSRGHRILCWIEIGLKLVEKGGWEFLLPQHWWSVHKHPKFYSSWCLHWSIYSRSENIDIVHDDFDLVYIESFAW